MRRAADIYAEAVLPHIPADGTWIEGQELAKKAGITRNSLPIAIRRIKELGPALPLIRKGSRYCFSVDSELVDNYRTAETRKCLTILLNLYSGEMKPFADNRPDFPFIDIVVRNYERAVEDLTDLASYRMDRMDS